MSLTPRTESADYAAASEKRVNVVQGEFQVSDDPRVVLTTILGSCVAACVHDPLAKIGGLNHFLLPGDRYDESAEGLRYGAYAMELLINALLQRGARRERLQAKLFGGARVMGGLSDIGEQNSTFAETYLKREGITLTGSSLRGDQARRLQYWPAAGRVRQFMVRPADTGVFQQERVRPAPAPIHDSIELF